MATSSPPVLAYSGPPAPSAYDLALESERSRWLRRRFLYYCALSLLLVGLTALSSLGAAVEEAGRGRFRPATAVSFLLNAAGTLLFAAAAVRAWRSPIRREAILRLTLGLTVVVGCMFVIGQRLVLEMLFPGVRFSASPRWAVWRMAPLLSALLPACLFMPWTLRELLRPVAVLTAVAAAVIVLDVAAGRMPAQGLVFILLLPVAAAPGALVCLWRHSKFRKTFRLEFESAGYRKLQADLVGARRVHESCLPRPRLDGPVRMNFAYEPMREIGGDLLWVHVPLPSRDPRDARAPAALSATFDAVLMDVTGHGIAAALTVNRLVGELERVFAERPDLPPGDVLCALNRYVELTLARHDIFATALCLRLDGDRGLVQWASGGHPTALLRRADGSLEELHSTAMVLGVLDDDEFRPEPAELPFRPGDAVVAFTDGACEARDPSGRMLGAQGVRRLVQSVTAGAGRVTAADGAANGPLRWPEAILASVRGHREAPAEDDTLVVALFRPSNPPAC